MSSSGIPVYFEESWAIISSVSLINCLFALMVMGITSRSPLTTVAIVVSAAGAIANGLCFYAFYANYPIPGTVAAAAVADIMWMIQEAGMSFYSYFILIRVLKRRERIIFLSLFWLLMAVIIALRCLILANRARDILAGGSAQQELVSHLHIGYFSTLAIVECVSSYFLLRVFIAAKTTSAEVSSNSSLFRHLIRSTEVRLTSLALAGITRSITYSFQTTAQTATSVAGQVDRFVVTFQNMFPVILFIDILASRLTAVTNTLDSSGRSHALAGPNMNNNVKSDGTSRGVEFISSANRRRANNDKTHGQMYPMSNIETRVDANGIRSSSQEHIISPPSLQGSEDLKDYELEAQRGGINKTVEFVFHESSVRH